MLFFGDAAQGFTPGPVHLLAVLLLGLLVVQRLQSRGSLRGRVARRLRIPLLALTVWVWIFSTPILANGVLRHLEGDPLAPPPAELIRRDDHLFVVMGAGIPWSAAPDGQARLNAAGWRRIEAAASHWQRHGGRLLIAGGLGNPDDPTRTSVAAEMSRIAIRLGVPAARITTIGHLSRNSYDDLLAARPLVLEHSGRRWLITSASHVPRVADLARAMAMPLAYLPCDFRQIHAPGWQAWLPNHGGADLWALGLHEVMGRVVYWLRGWSRPAG